MKILTARQMQEVDRRSTEEAQVPSLTLMENAGFNLFLALDRRFEDLKNQQIAIICGKGNNGGDGSVLARQLIQRGVYPDVFLLTTADQVTGDAKVNLDILLASQYPVFEISSEEEWEVASANLELYDIVVDALLGTGINQPLRDLYRTVVADINQCRGFVLAVDIPSGLFSDSAEAPQECVWADVTVTFTAPKIAHVLTQAQEALGELEVVQIGTPPQLLDTAEFNLNLLTRESVQEYLLPRPASSHKGSYGHVAIIAGSQGKSGAACLSSYAALRSGAGLVTALVPSAVQSLVASNRTEIMTEGLPSTPAGTFDLSAAEPALELLADKDCGAIGPGLTTEPATVEFIERVVNESSIPLVIDADGLNAFSDRMDRCQNRTQQPLVLTPHPGEFSRLTGIPTVELLSRQLEIARDFCEEWKVWLVLKTFRPLIATPDGQIYVSPQGNPGMATAGMGDVLTGILTSVIGQYQAAGMTDPEELTCAVCLAVYLHGTAGDLAVAEIEPSALAGNDVIEHLSAAFKWLAAE